MGERDMRNARRRKHRRQKRYAWTVAGILFLCILAADFCAGFFVGYSRIKRVEQDNTARFEDFGNDVTQDCETREENVYDKSGDEDVQQINDADTQWNLVLVNDQNPVPDEYEVNLVEVEGGEYVDARIYEPLMEMLEDAKEVNWNQLPRIVSGYRTTQKQQQLYDDKIDEYHNAGYSEDEAKELARQWVAAPGYSEHQLGLAVDLNGANYDFYLWLQENSHQYGFVFRYPGYKTEITGIAEEVWHYRYVGVEAATAIYEQGICLEEYLAEMSEATMNEEMMPVMDGV